MMVMMNTKNIEFDGSGDDDYDVTDDDDSNTGGGDVGVTDDGAADEG